MKLIGRVGFYSNGIWEFKRADDSVELLRAPDSPSAKWILIFGRDHYFESVKDYPIGQLNDLRKIIKNEPWRFPYEGERFDRIERLSPQAHRVTSWIVRKELINGVDGRPLFVVPESACFPSLAVGEPLSLQRLGQELNVAETPEGLISTLGQRTLFNRQIGVPDENEGESLGDCRRLSEAQTASALLAGLKQIFFASPTRFLLHPETKRFSAYPWPEAAKLSAFVTVLYLILGSGYLWIAGAWIDYNLERHQIKAESSIEVRKKMTDFQSRLDGMVAVASTIAPSWIAWDIFLDLLETGVTFRAVNSTAPSVTFYMTAERATEVLEWLNRDVRVATAEFALPVRKVNGLDQFAIEVEFNYDAKIGNDSVDAGTKRLMTLSLEGTQKTSEHSSVD